MPERWRSELEKLDGLQPPGDVVEHARWRSPGWDTDGPSGRSRLVAAVVAFAVFVLAGSFAWRAFDTDTPRADVGPTNGLPVLTVRITDQGPYEYGPGEYGPDRLVETVIDYGDAHEESFTSTTPHGAIVDWVAVQELSPFVPGPTAGSNVAIEADGEDPRVLIGTPDAWPDFERFERIEQLPSVPGEYVLVFEVDYPAGTASTARRIQIVEPGVVQLALTEGGKPGAALATAYVDGMGVDGFLSTSSFAKGDLGVQTMPRPPELDGMRPLIVHQETSIVVATPVDEARAGLAEGYEQTPETLPLDLVASAPTISSEPGSYLLAVDAIWRHGKLGWGSEGTAETARFFFPVEVMGTSSEEPPPATESPALDPIVVTSPTRGTEVTSPVTVAGTAEVFEGTVTIWIFDGTNNRIAETFATASCGSGCRGDFSVEVPYSVGAPQAGEIVVFEVSAENGKRQHTVRIPVTLTPGPQDPVAAAVEGKWFDEAGNPLGGGSGGEPFVMSVFEGPDHCGMTSLSIARLAWPIGSSFTEPDETGLNNRTYIRDPQGLGWTSPTAPFESGERLPGDASFTGYRSGEWQLWVAPTDRNEAIYMVNGDPDAGGVWERWPRDRISCF